MPVGWEVRKLGDVCDIFNGSTPLRRKKEYWNNGTINWFTIGDIRKQGRTIKFTNQKITEEGFKKSSLKLLPINSILLCCTASVGEFAITQVELTTNQQFNGLVVKDEIYLLPKYLYYFSSTLKKRLLNVSGKTTIDFVSMTKVKKINIPLPPLPEQKRIVVILDKAFTAINKAKANTEQNLKNARELFQSKLQETFDNGKLKVENGEWEMQRINKVCELKSGTTISPSLERKNGDVLYTKISDMNLSENLVEMNTSSRFANKNEIKVKQIIPEGAVIFPKRGGAIATNKKRKVVKPTIVDLNTMAIIPGKNINKDYFFQWFQMFDLSGISNGTSIPQINNYSFNDVYISYPKSLKEQKLIVKRLDSISTETQKLEIIYQQKINDLEELKRSILQKSFNGEL